MPLILHLQVPCHILHLGWKLNSFYESRSRMEIFPHLHPRTTLSADQSTPSKRTTFSLVHLEEEMKSTCHLMSRSSLLLFSPSLDFFTIHFFIIFLVPFLGWKPCWELDIEDNSELKVEQVCLLSATCEQGTNRPSDIPPIKKKKEKKRKLGF